MSNNNISITTEALSKVHLHSFKHHASSVNGILLGKADKNSILITDIIPLFHTQTLLPMFEVAMIQIEKYCRDNNIDMVGYYHSNQCIANELEPEPIAKKIADRLNNELNNMCFLMISKIEVNRPSGLVSIDKVGSDWLKNRKTLITIDTTSNSEDINEILKRNLQNIKESQIYDFEEYLSNPTRDWLNKSLVL
ncbi:hypothetical protein ACTFIW_003589 [Dictyostelium discoideum]